jgi:cytochrome c peroxidase
MKKATLFLLGLMLLIITAFKLTEKYDFVVPKGWPKPVFDFKKNKLTQEKIFLGRVLFYEPLLSRDNTISCANCHSSFHAFTHVDHALSHGVGDSIGKRNALPLMNLAWQKQFMWDGSISDLNFFSRTPITHPKEMASSLEDVQFKLKKSDSYADLFLKAFGDSGINKERILTSLSAFCITLVSSNSKYDSVMRHQVKFTLQEKNGYRLFKQNCASCHKEPLFTDYSFKNNGLSLDKNLNDSGRMSVTHQIDDYRKFKVPTLRNVEYTYPYMHDGRFKKLSQVLSHYSKGIEDDPNLAEQLKGGLELTSDERVDIIAFLLTLSDRTFVFNNEFQTPKILIK